MDSLPDASSSPPARSFWTRRDVQAWCLYDWANSAFVTSVITVIMPVYFLTLTPSGGGPVDITFGTFVWHTSGDALFAYISGAYMLAAALVSPLLGALADRTGASRGLLALFVAAGSAACAGLAFVGSGEFLLCGGVFALAAFAWNCANPLYDALLPRLAADRRELDAISSAGYAVGYLGGGLLLAVHLAITRNPAWVGLPDAPATMPLVFVSTALWWLLFSIPVIVTRPHGSAAAPRAPWGASVVAAFTELRGTLTRLREHRAAWRMLLAFMVFNTGIGTVITNATLFGKSELKLPVATMIGCVLMIQLLGVPAALGFIRLARRLGTRGAILAGLTVYLLILLVAFRMTTAAEFWLLGVLVALVQGGTQALSRSLYGALIPLEKSAEFFAFFSVFSKVGNFMGPLTFALVRDATGSLRYAILALAIFFLLGGALLLRVPQPSEPRP